MMRENNIFKSNSKSKNNILDKIFEIAYNVCTLMFVFLASFEMTLGYLWICVGVMFILLVIHSIILTEKMSLRRYLTYVIMPNVSVIIVAILIIAFVKERNIRVISLYNVLYQVIFTISVSILYIPNRIISNMFTSKNKDNK